MTARRKPAGAAKKRQKSELGEEASFEDALSRLEGIVTRLEEGEVSLEESLRDYAEGTRLVQQCLKRLEEARTTIRELTEGKDGFSLKRSGLADEIEETEQEDDEEDDGDEDDGRLF